MSEIAGRMSIQAAAACLEKSRGGMGALMGGAVGVQPCEVVIIGGGVVGSSAAAMALGLGADVTIVDRSMPTLRQLNARFGDRLKTVFSTRDSLARLLRRADVVVIGVLVPGAAAPRLVTRQDVAEMKTGSVIVDVAIDQGGGAETSRATTHDEPTYIVDDVVHYCVANMPGAVAQTSTFALNNATLPFVVQLANLGVDGALQANQDLLAGLSTRGGQLCNAEVARAFGFPLAPPNLVAA
jgi:alanine dehydrogenase